MNPLVSQKFMFGKALTLTPSSANANGKIPIHEIYESISGEGPTVGWPTVFIRVAGCNRTCDWCDTGYVNKRSASALVKRSKRIAPEKIASLLNENYDLRNRHVCITGGEPTIRVWELSDLFALLPQVQRWSVETNGELLTDKKYIDLSPTHCQWIISPKMPSSGNASVIWLDIIGHSRVYYKFVVADEKDIEYLKNIEGLLLECRNEIYIQPASNDPVALQVILRSDLFSKIPVDFSNQRKRYKPTRRPVGGPPEKNSVQKNRVARGLGEVKEDPSSSPLSHRPGSRSPNYRISFQVHKFIGMS